MDCSSVDCSNLERKVNGQESTHAQSWQLSAVQGGFETATDRFSRALICPSSAMSDRTVAPRQKALAVHSRHCALPAGGMAAGHNPAQQLKQQPRMPSTLQGGLTAVTQEQKHGMTHRNQHRGALQGSSVPAVSQALQGSSVSAPQGRSVLPAGTKALQGSSVPAGPKALQGGSVPAGPRASAQSSIRHVTHQNTSGNTGQQLCSSTPFEREQERGIRF